MTSDVFMFFSDYTYYETLGPQQPSVQWQISCIKNLVTHPSDVAPPAYDWNDVAVSTVKKKKKISICVFKKGENVEKRAFFLLWLLLFQQQSWPQVIPDVSLAHSQNESPHFYSILPPQRNSKGTQVKYFNWAVLWNLISSFPY